MIRFLLMFLPLSFAFLNGALANEAEDLKLTLEQLRTNNEYMERYSKTEFASAAEFVDLFEFKPNEEISSGNGERYRTWLKLDVARLNTLFSHVETIKKLNFTPEQAARILSHSTYGHTRIQDSNFALFEASMNFQKVVLPLMMRRAKTIEDFETILMYRVAPAAEFEWAKREMMDAYLVQGFALGGVNWLKKFRNHQPIYMDGGLKSSIGFLAQVFPHESYSDEAIIAKSLIYILTLHEDIKKLILRDRAAKQGLRHALLGMNGEKTPLERLYTPEMARMVQGRSREIRRSLIELLKIKMEQGHEIRVDRTQTNRLIRLALDSGYRLTLKDKDKQTDLLVSIQDEGNRFRAYATLGRDLSLRALRFNKNCETILLGMGRR